MICYLCGHDINPCITDPRDPTVKTMDHVKPRAMGGTKKGNLRAAHRICNITKSARTPTKSVLAECKAAFESTKEYKRRVRKLSRQISTRSEYFCIGEMR